MSRKFSKTQPNEAPSAIWFRRWDVAIGDRLIATLLAGRTLSASAHWLNRNGR